jgi:hypothetical protein
MKPDNYVIDLLKEGRSEGILVSAPTSYQGVGNALRSVFVPDCHHIPNEWEELLSKMQ